MTTSATNPAYETIFTTDSSTGRVEAELKVRAHVEESDYGTHVHVDPAVLWDMMGRAKDRLRDVKAELVDVLTAESGGLLKASHRRWYEAMNEKLAEMRGRLEMARETLSPDYLKAIMKPECVVPVHWTGLVIETIRKVEETIGTILKREAQTPREREEDGEAGIARLREHCSFDW